MVLFVTCLEQEGLASFNIQNYLSGICQVQRAVAFPDPLIDHMPWLCQVLRGISIQATRIGRHSHPCLPITPSILCKLRRVWLEGDPTFNNIMLWTMSMTTFFGLCRSRKSQYSVNQRLTHKPTFIFLMYRMAQNFDGGKV